MKLLVLHPLIPCCLCIKQSKPFVTVWEAPCHLTELTFPVSTSTFLLSYFALSSPLLLHGHLF